MKYLKSLILPVVLLSGCGESKLKSIGKLVLTNQNARDIEVSRVLDMGDTSLHGTISAGSSIDGFYSSESMPYSCKIRWRKLNPKEAMQDTVVTLGHLAGMRLGGYEIILNKDLTWRQSRFHTLDHPLLPENRAEQAMDVNRPTASQSPNQCHPCHAATSHLTFAY